MAGTDNPGTALDDFVVVTQRNTILHFAVVGASVGDPNIVRIGVQNNENAFRTLNDEEFGVIVFHPG